MSMTITATEAADLTEDEATYLRDRSVDGDLQTALGAYHHRQSVSVELGEKYARAGENLESLEKRIEIARRLGTGNAAMPVFLKRPKA